jgi:hypothetical protein
MMRDGWEAIGALFDVTPCPEELVDGGDLLIGHRRALLGHGRRALHGGPANGL